MTGPPGTVVMMDQTTWHAVLPRAAGQGLRLLFGLWFASATAPPSVTVDETLCQLDAPSALLLSLLPRGARA
ncbi:MAG TPA: hypothetical protein ENK57_20655 [Polyangiaceae bacterium]|nr:hypothetical protein [Polyangiaceae bacterium]